MSSKKISELDQIVTLSTKKISELDQIVTLSSTDIQETSDASGLLPSKKESRDQTQTYINANTQLPSTAKVTGLDTQLSSKLNINGGTMTGFLVLNANPSTAMEASTKQYVDNSFSDLTLQDAYNNSPAPQSINFAEGEGLVLNDHLGNPKYTYSETLATFLNDFIVSKNGTDALLVFSTRDPNSTVFEVMSTNYGSIPFPIMTQSQRDAIDVSGNPLGLGIYNSTTNSYNYFGNTGFDTLLSIEHIIQGDNMSIVNNGDGTVTFNASGGSSTGVEVNGSFSGIQNNSSTTPSTSVYSPVVINPVAFTPINQNGTSVTTDLIDGVNTPIIINTAGGSRWCTVNFDISIAPSFSALQYYTFNLCVLKGDGSSVATEFFKSISINELGFHELSINGLVELDTNDGVYLTALCNVSSQPFVSYYFNGTLTDTTINNLPNTDFLEQGEDNIYLSNNGGFSLNIQNNKVTSDMLSGAIPASKLNGYDIDTVGTITTGAWQATKIGGSYLDYNTSNLKVTGVQLDTIQNISSAASPQFTGLSIAGLTPSKPVFTDPSNNITSAGVVSETNGGTHQSSYTLGDILYASATNTLSKLPGNTTSSKLFFTQTGTGSASAAPAWSAISASDVGTALINFSTVTTSTQTMSSSTLYFNNYTSGQCVFTLPNSPSLYTVVAVMGLTTASTSGWKVNAQGSDKIQFINQLGASAGSLTSTPTSATDQAFFIYAATGLWLVYNSSGNNLTVA